MPKQFIILGCYLLLVNLVAFQIQDRRADVDGDLAGCADLVIELLLVIVVPCPLFFGKKKQG